MGPANGFGMQVCAPFLCYLRALSQYEYVQFQRGDYLVLWPTS